MNEVSIDPNWFDAPAGRFKGSKTPSSAGSPPKLKLEAVNDWETTLPCCWAEVCAENWLRSLLEDEPPDVVVTVVWIGVAKFVFPAKITAGWIWISFSLLETGKNDPVWGAPNAAPAKRTENYRNIDLN